MDVTGTRDDNRFLVIVKAIQMCVSAQTRANQTGSNSPSRQVGFSVQEFQKQFCEVGDHKVSFDPSGGMSGGPERVYILSQRCQKSAETKCWDSAQCKYHFPVLLTDSPKCSYILTGEYRTHTVLPLSIYYDSLTVTWDHTS